MTKNKTKTGFQPKSIIEYIRHFSPNSNPAAYLMNLFSMSRETAYRRLRNQIPFTIEEAIAMADNLNLSVDKLLGLNTASDHLLIKGFNFKQEPVDIYSDLLNSDISLMEKILSSKEVGITFIMSRIPFRFLPYESLFKLDYCHYMYSIGKISLMTHYSDIELPDSVLNLQRKSASLFSRLKNVTCIIDSTIYTDIIKKIQYYYRSKFISDQDLQDLQSELLNLLGAYENMLRSGKNSAGSEYVFYFSFFNFESNTAFCEYDKNTLLLIWIYPESPIVISNNQLMNEVQKKWIESKIRNSILITKTSDIQQIEMLRDTYRQIKGLKD